MRYPWLDGLRGLAALYVLLHHAAAEVPKGEMRGWLGKGTRWLDHGHYAVAVFIVLSGYCLMLPVARDSNGRLRGGGVDYLRRRARRILPPYYAALALSMALIALIPALQFRGNPRWVVALPESWTTGLTTHLLLIHNVQFIWTYVFNPPLWSVATEWQIYFLFPVLLFVWRRYGIVSTVAVAFGVALVILEAMGEFASLAMCPWYLGLFAFGMAAACRGTPMRPPSRWDALTLVIMVPVVLGLSTKMFQTDVLVGAATAALLGFCAANDGQTNPRPLAHRILESRTALALGTISYSLYLIHYPLLSLASNLMIVRGVGGTTRALVMLLVVAPLVIVAAWVFHLACERPFLAKRPAAPSASWRGPSRRRPRANTRLEG